MFRGHVALQDKLANLRLEAHVEHSVCLVENKMLCCSKQYNAAIDEVLQPSGRRHEHVDTLSELAELRTGVGAAVNYHCAKRRCAFGIVKCEPPCLMMDLNSKFTSGRHHHHARLCRGAIVSFPDPLGGTEPRNDRQKKCTRFARSRLRA